MSAETNALINSARCVDSCVPLGAIASIVILLTDKVSENSNFPIQRAVKGEQGEIVGGEGGDWIQEE